MTMDTPIRAAIRNLENLTISEDSQVESLRSAVLDALRAVEAELSRLTTVPPRPRIRPVDQAQQAETAARTIEAVGEFEATRIDQQTKVDARKGARDFIDGLFGRPRRRN